MVFDDITRTDTDFAAFSEGNFSFLNRSARPEFAACRELIDEWFSNYPADHQNALRARLRSRTEHQFDSAFFELYLHELLSRLGFRVEVEPSPPPGRSRWPDFSITAPNGAEILLEAVVVSDRTATQVAAQKRMDELLNGLNELESPNYFLWVRSGGTPSSAIPRRQWTEEARAFLAQLEQRAEPPTLSGGLDSLPCLELEHAGWSVRIIAMPKQSTRGKSGGRALGSFTPAPSRGDARTPLRDALLHKATRYGDVGRTYVVAANCRLFHTDRDDILAALLGHERLVIEPEEKAGELRRYPDGAWTSLKGPRYTRVSAAIVACTIYPWSVAGVTPTIYHNPWAAHPCVDSGWSIPAETPVGGRMIHFEGRSGADIFGLPNDWPRCFAAS